MVKCIRSGGVEYLSSGPVCNNVTLGPGSLPLTTTRDGFASPGAHRQNHRQHPTSQPTLLFTRRTALAKREPTTRFRIRHILV